MSVQLTNRQSVRAQLSQFIEDMAIPEEMIRFDYYFFFTKKHSIKICYIHSKKTFVKNEMKNIPITRLTIFIFLYSVIMQTAVTEKDFNTQLSNLNHKLNLVKELQFKDAKSSEDVKDVLEKLKIKAMSKIRQYLLEQIYKFRKPMTNYQIPQNAMLKNKFFFEFILCNERQVGQEICNEYVDTMSKIYYSYFKVKIL